MVFLISLVIVPEYFEAGLLIALLLRLLSFGTLGTGLAGAPAIRFRLRRVPFVHASS